MAQLKIPSPALIRMGTVFTLATVCAGSALPCAYAGVSDGRAFERTPVGFIDFDAEHRLVNLTPDQEPERTSVEAPHVLKLDDYRDGFRSVKQWDVEGGIGILGSWHFKNSANSAFLPFVGILPIVGKTAQSSRFVKTKEEADAIPLFKTPHHASDIEAWKAGDSMTFESSGGVLFFAGGGKPVLDVGVSYLATGTWNTYVEKTGSNQVFAKLTHTHLKELSVSAVTALVEVDVGLFKGADDFFSFVFDLSRPEARLAYEDFMRGHVGPAQELAARPGYKAVQLDEMGDAHRHGWQAHLLFGVPLVLDMQLEHSKYQEVENVRHQADGTETNTESGVYMKELTTQVFWFNHIRRTFGFTATSVEKIKRDGGQQDGSGESASLTWTYQNDFATSGGLSRAIGDLIRQTGLKNELAIRVPEGENLNYAAVKFELNLPALATNRLMTLATGSPELEKLQQEAHDRVAQYFGSGVDSAELCPNSGRTFDYACESRLTQETESAIDHAIRAIQKMKGLLEGAKIKDRSAYVKAYSEFGRQMMHNQFAFQALLGLFQGQGVEMDYRIEGERISRYRRQILDRRAPVHSLN